MYTKKGNSPRIKSKTKISMSFKKLIEMIYFISSGQSELYIVCLTF